MKNALFAIVLALLIVLSASTSYADDPPKPPQTQPAAPDVNQSVMSRLRQAAAQLKMTDEQKKQMSALLDKAGGDLKTTAEKFKSDSQARAREAQDIFDRLRQDIGDVLSVEQRQELQRRFESLMGGTAGVLELFRQQIEKLELTDAQKKQIDQIMTEARGSFSALRDQARAGSQEAREKILDLYTETRKKLEQALTAEQLRQLRQNLASPAQGGKEQKP